MSRMQFVRLYPMNVRERTRLKYAEPCVYEVIRATPVTERLEACLKSGGTYSGTPGNLESAKLSRFSASGFQRRLGGGGPGRLASGSWSVLR
jgi:hypothetical protein